MEKPKYIQNAIVWRAHRFGSGVKGWWLRCTDLTMVNINDEEVYISALCGSPLVYYHNA